MGIMDTTAKAGGVVTFDLCVGKNGDPIYRVSWYNCRNKRWRYLRYKSFEEAHKTYTVIREMI